MRLTYGPLRIILAKTYKHGNSLYFQQHVPTDLRDRYPSVVIKHSLKTLDPVKAARLVEALERRYTAEFAGLRAAPESSPQALAVHADGFLRKWGLAPQSSDNDPMAVRLLHDYFDDKRGQYAQGDDVVHREAHPADYLSPVEAQAWQRLHVKSKATITAALDVYIETHKKRDKVSFTTNTRRTFGALVAVTGDKVIEDFTREDGLFVILQDSL